MEENKIDFSKIVKEQKSATRKAKRNEKEEIRNSKIRKWKRISLISLITLIAVFGFGYWFANNYYLRTPLMVQNPIVARENTVSILSPTAYAEPTAELTDMEIIEQYKLSPIIKSVYMLESTYGDNDYCKEKGLFNGYGYRQNDRENKCFKSFEEVTGYVNEWLEERLASNGNNIVEAVCYYNKGVANMKSCEYSDNLLSILVDNL